MRLILWCDQCNFAKQIWKTISCVWRICNESICPTASIYIIHQGRKSLDHTSSCRTNTKWNLHIPTNWSRRLSLKFTINTKNSNTATSVVAFLLEIWFKVCLVKFPFLLFFLLPTMSTMGAGQYCYSPGLSPF